MTVHIWEPRQTDCEFCHRRFKREKLCTIIRTDSNRMALACEPCMLDIDRRNKMRKGGASE